MDEYTTVSTMQSPAPGSVPGEEPAPAEGKKQKSPFEPGGFSGTIYTIFHDMVLLLAFVTFIFVFFTRLVVVNGSSMYPTLVGTSKDAGTAGDYLIFQSNVICTGYEYGDIVVACVPSFEDGKPIVKRVIGTPGQTVSFHAEDDGYLHVYVDGVRLEESYIRAGMVSKTYTVDGFTATVPEGCYFLMGDNRNNSTDSRYPDIGMVDERFITGKALLVAIPGQDAEKDGKRDFGRLGKIGND